MRLHVVGLIGLALGTFALAGCGTRNHLTGTPSSANQSPRSTTVQRSRRAPTSASPSSSRTKTPSAPISTTSPTASKPQIADTSSVDETIAVVIHRQFPWPVELPTSIPSIDSHSSWPVTATTQETSHSYQVTYWRSTAAWPINSAQIPHSAHKWVATIQGVHYGSTTQAYSALQTQAAPTWIPLAQLGTPSTSILLTPGTTARLYPSGVLQWAVGDWTIQVINGSRAADMTVAESLLTSINPASLPASHGLLAATATASGEQFQAAWANGPNVYGFTPFAQQMQGNGAIYDRMLSAKSGASLFIHVLTSIKAE
ncbi:MAG: hypothetical protein C7B46_11395 [Sulfobacillus benefaciens]|uniref:DUF4367 domain-containing protein n=1 Tax=Sulfobacillus benefaciens TaxID=453960 RepID=A0A2T2XF56_9FIRM|nr:MAG: hypothetical protein C7B46_11395 [Sulfobacillus benefaciens]